MKEFIEKLIGRLEEISVENTCSDCPYKAKCDEVQEHINDETTDLCGATIKELSIEIANELAEEYKGGWIPCSETEPKKDGYYLITTSDGEMDIREYLYSKGWGWDGFERIIAWQPLPKPYKAEEPQWKKAMMNTFLKR